METKKAKVKSRDFYKKAEYKGEMQYKFYVTFEGDEKKHLYTSSKEDPKYFKVGEEQEYTYDYKTGEKDGNTWELHIVKPVYPNKGGYGGGNQQLSIEDYVQREKVKATTYGMSYSKDLAVAGVIKPEEMGTYAKKFLDFMTTQMDKLIKKG